MSYQRFRIYFAVILTCSKTESQVAVDSSSYVAGVVEYHPNFDLDQAPDIINHNLENYVKFIQMAKNKSVDILVFPEATFNRHWAGTPEFNKRMAFVVPEDSEKTIVCDDAENYHKMLVGISCAAKEHQMYVVINVVELANCTNNTTDGSCPTSGLFLFNTNVVFDRNGAVISKYRKINLFGEPGFKPSLDQKLGVFETDFGVKFGHFICFDLLFQIPAVQVLQQEKIQNVIFPTMWFSEMPFLVAAEIQQSYAYTHNVNFLASGANNPHVGSTGSGIYSGREGALISVMRGQPTSELLVAEVPKTPVTISNRRKVLDTHSPDSPDVLDELLLKHDRLTHYESYLFNDSLEDQTANLTSGRINCVFNLKIDSNSVSFEEDHEYYRYRAIAFDGIRSFVYKDSGVANCGIVACTNDKLTSCAMRFPKYSAHHERIHIKSAQILATVPKPHYDKTVHCDNIVYHPVSLSTKIMPLDVGSFDYKTTDLPEYQLLNMTLTKPQSELLTFGIAGLIFDKKLLETA